MCSRDRETQQKNNAPCKTVCATRLESSSSSSNKTSGGGGGGGGGGERFWWEEAGAEGANTSATKTVTQSPSFFPSSFFSLFF